jgi:uncharacterized protein with HEPN domain
MRDDRLNITYIAECIYSIQSYAQDEKAAFMQSSMIQNAVVRNFLVIGNVIQQDLSDLSERIHAIQQELEL